MSNKPLPIIKTPEYKLHLPITDQDLIYRPYNVADEKILLSASMEKNENAQFYVDNTLSVLRGVVQNDINIEILPAAEVDLFFINLRSVSVGEDMKFSFVEKDETKNASANIKDFYISKPPKEHYKIDLVDGIGLKMRNITFKERIMYGIKDRKSVV